MSLMQSEDAGLEARVSTPLQCQNVEIKARSHKWSSIQSSKLTFQHHRGAQTQSSRPACQTRSSTQSLKLAFQHHRDTQTRSSRLASSDTSTAKLRAQARVPTAEEPCVSVITTPISGSSTAHVMKGVNPHHGGFLGDSFTPETPINSSVCYWRRVEIFQLRNTHKEINSPINLLSSSFCLSLFEILLDKSCATLSVIQGEDFQKSLMFAWSTENKIHFSPLRKEFSLK